MPAQHVVQNHLVHHRQERNHGHSTTVEERHQHKARPLIFGEVLFDVFPDATVIGGAPFNVAWHLQGFGFRPLLVSRVGADPAGAKALEIMRSWGMDDSCVQIDSGHATGEVRIELLGDGHRFTILPDRAYDHIDADAVLHALGSNEIGLIYHGTLALRSDESRHALLALCERLYVPRCVDINLRSPWWSRSQVAALINGADWVKLNDEELTLIADDMTRTLRDQAADLRQRHDIDTLIVTRGAQGAVIVDGAGAVESAAATMGEVVDTVGAGDAFAAVALIGLMLRWSAADTLRRALEFAAWTCTLRGAVLDAPEPYRRFRRSWEAERA
jgi:fructokinase